MKRRWLIVTVVVIVTILLVLIVTRIKRTRDTINIGVLVTLTGEARNYGEWTRNGAMMAAEEINQSGGVNGKKLNLVVEDHQNNPTLAVNAFRNLITINGIPVAITITSGVVLAIAPVAEQNHVIQINTAALNPQIKKAGDYTFSLIADADTEAKVLAGFIIHNLRLTQIAVFHSTASYGVSGKDAFIRQFNSLGGNIVGVETYNESDTDYKTQLFKLKNLNAQGIYLAGTSRESGFILKQAKEAGLQTQWFSYAPFQGQDVLTIARDAAEGIIYTYQSYDPDSSDTQIKDFAQKYKAQYGIPPEIYSATAYDAIRIIAEVVKRVGTDPVMIKDALYQIKDFPGVTGNISFDSDGSVEKTIVLKTVKNGEFIFYK